MTNYAFELLYDNYFDEIMRNLSKLEENDRYYNWYHGYTELKLPYIDTDFGGNGGVYYELNTAATSGTISTRHFGDQSA